MAELPPKLKIHPPLINSASPWATTLDDLRRLYACPSTGAVTTRTSLIQGFDHDTSKHQYIFFEPSTHTASTDCTTPGSSTPPTASLNSLGYSPLPLETYLSFISTISAEQEPPTGTDKFSSKGFIVSVTGSPDDIAASYKLIASAARHTHLPLAMEINLSCPNIPGRPPPAYSRDALATYLAALQHTLVTTAPTTDTTTVEPRGDSESANKDRDRNSLPRIPVGLKTPPYTHATEYEALMDALEAAAAANGGACPVSFLTATNTLGSCLVLAGDEAKAKAKVTESRQPKCDAGEEEEEERLSTLGHKAFALPGPGLGGMAGAPLHPLALGNVCTLRRMLDQRGEKLGCHVQLVGVGGVLDAQAYRRMRAVGADVVGVATGLGLKGVGVFGEIQDGLGGRW
ncbi:FMN-linked oxidoreductase [Canariomyces notabilis]|uniref:Dihydroorotate dehydrogenase (fumarate) n=1 Tax=Canariomyces notabilis TaxID=2074819 RepID=A0AAN6TFP3_9PEZI|nr:FMN-linked oxidoreductase [Canariomyces arenarius]